MARTPWSCARSCPIVGITPGPGRPGPGGRPDPALAGCGPALFCTGRSSPRACWEPRRFWVMVPGCSPKGTEDWASRWGMDEASEDEPLPTGPWLPTPAEWSKLTCCCCGTGSLRGGCNCAGPGCGWACGGTSRSCESPDSEGFTSPGSVAADSGTAPRASGAPGCVDGPSAASGGTAVSTMLCSLPVRTAAPRAPGLEKCCAGLAGMPGPRGTCCCGGGGCGGDSKVRLWFKRPICCCC